MVNWADLFTYEPDTGRLLWKVKRPGPSSPDVGEEAGTVLGGRYRSVQIRRKRYYVHRIIWEMFAGPIAGGLYIDHIDGNGLNNRWGNLRLTTLSVNQRNRRVSKNSRTGVPGVNHHGQRDGFNVYCATRYVGYTKDFDQAVAMRKAAEAQSGYHPNHGRKMNANA